MRKLNYLKAVVIVHGKSEKQIVQYIKQKLRLKIAIESEKNGEKSIQITSLKNVLSNKKFCIEENFIKYFCDAERVDGKIPEYFKIFIIMDTDDCKDIEKLNYINKEMFRNHWAYHYIVPIYNDMNLEDVLMKAGVPFRKRGENRKSEYVQLFPTCDKFDKTDSVQIEELMNNLSLIDSTNMDEFLKFCLDSTRDLRP